MKTAQCPSLCVLRETTHAQYACKSQGHSSENQDKSMYWKTSPMIATRHDTSCSAALRDLPLHNRQMEQDSSRPRNEQSFPRFRHDIDEVLALHRQSSPTPYQTTAFSSCTSNSFSFCELYQNRLHGLKYFTPTSKMSSRGLP